VLEFPVIKIAEKDIVDTNGAGDAFVGGKQFSHMLIHLLSPVLYCLDLWQDQQQQSPIQQSLL